MFGRASCRSASKSVQGSAATCVQGDSNHECILSTFIRGEMVPGCAAAICAFLVMPLVIHARYWGNERVCAGPQNVHIEPTSRLGGAAVFLAYVVAVTLALTLEHMPLRSALTLLISALPVVIVGLWEDIARRVSPGQRLLAAVGSAALASAIAQGCITRLDLPLVDGWLAYLPFAVPLTWFMVAGACNAINLIDGNHGLAGGTGVVMFFGMAMVAGRAGDELILLQALGMIGALVGFLLWNYPHGRVFLGDAGAYFIGFMYAQLSIQLITRNAGVSAWFVIALTAYPIAETLFSMYRRKIVRRVASMQPDAQHLHSLLYLHFLRFAEAVDAETAEPAMCRSPSLASNPEDSYAWPMRWSRRACGFIPPFALLPR